MDNKTLQEIFEITQEKARKAKINTAYVEGKNHFILKERRPKEKPDHRIPVPLAKMTVDDMSGYAGRAGDRITKYEFTEKEVDGEYDDPFIDYMRYMDEYNEEKIETAELYEDACSQGVAYEIWWSSDDTDYQGRLTAEYKIVPSSSVWIKWSDGIKKWMEFFVYFYGDEKTRLANVYYPLMMETWTSENGKEFMKSEEDVPHPFKTPPLNIFAANRQERPIFEAGKPLIDAYDIIISRSMNEVERFNDLTLLIGKSVTEEFTEAISEGDITIIDGLDDAARTDLPRYLQKDFSGVNELYKNLMDRILGDYNAAIIGVDFRDENFSGNQSGVAQAYKLLKLEFLASKIDTYFNRGMKRRLELYADVYNTGNASPIDVNDYKATVITKRNIPVDVKAMVDIAVLLSTLVSEETVLEYIPNSIVPDVKKEIEKKLRESEERQALSQSILLEDQPAE